MPLFMRPEDCNLVVAPIVSLKGAYIVNTSPYELTVWLKKMKDGSKFVLANCNYCEVYFCGAER